MTEYRHVTPIQSCFKIEVRAKRIHTSSTQCFLPVVQHIAVAGCFTSRAVPTSAVADTTGDRIQNTIREAAKKT